MNWYKIAKLKDVSLKGELKKTDDGFVYLKVPDDIIHGFFPLIDDDGISEPPYFNKKYDKVGAHISVMHSDELDGQEIKEIGKEFNFELMDFKRTNPKGWDEMSQVYFINVSSPELEELREKYGLSKKHKGQQFHITIATKKSKRKSQ